ncbi:FAD-binding oxidoreductase [Ideonella dechloratans]|uniref:FAD-binding oxidoreductase n=1 Tax=Ideonella dechloratans TaxID=36863 RepID=A0A643FI02_IDEDE|nr:FAD-binding oxidoreductase [Ideonella dechloratans]KAB0584247.1 FAD-binding oxidoreductase [Ideonella dechloratans]UFU08593.1 FAD-binding oxidoreductase [Ideonella dechloratans]
MSFLSVDQDLARDSYYAATAQRDARFAPLDGSSDCDVAVVGGGLAGLTAALDLARMGHQVTLLEAKQVGWGASGRNGGQAIHGLACDQSVIEDQLGLDDARRVWSMSLEALELLQTRMEQHQIDAEWRQGYIGVATNARKGAELMQWADRMAQLYQAEFTRIPAADMHRWVASPRYHSGLYDPQSGHLHPLKYALGIARAAAAAGVRIHEETPVTALETGPVITVRTSRGTLRAKKVLLAGNVYLQGVAEHLERRIMPVGTYIVCSEAMDPALADSLIPTRSAVCDTNFVLDYLRTTNDHRMLYGGRVSYSTVTPPNLAESMRRRMVQTFPQLKDVKVQYAWGGFVDITMNRAPDFGRLRDNLYYLQGFSGHGLALTGLAGRLVAEAMNGDASRFDVFARLKHHDFPGGRLLRTPALVLGMAWYRLRDLLG